MQRNPSFSTGVEPAQREEMIRVAAYLRAAQRGFQAAGPEADWLAAEAQIDATLAHAAQQQCIAQLRAWITDWDIAVAQLMRLSQRSDAMQCVRVAAELARLQPARAAAMQRLRELECAADLSSERQSQADR